MSVCPSVRPSVRPSPVIFKHVLGVSCAVYPALFVEFRVRVGESFRGVDEGRGKVLIRFDGFNTGKPPWPPNPPLEETFMIGTRRKFTGEAGGLTPEALFLALFRLHTKKEKKKD